MTADSGSRTGRLSRARRPHEQEKNHDPKAVRPLWAHLAGGPVRLRALVAEPVLLAGRGVRLAEEAAMTTHVVAATVYLAPWLLLWAVAEIQARRRQGK